ncbi:MAG: hypothetical protein WCC37_21295, partial [Candidatus Sulfotelmatobacter sp.]
VQGWLNLIQLCRPDKLILDYSPTVSLAARIAKVPTVLIGNGFELPPLTDPLPPFPGFSWATADVAAQSERKAVSNANAILQACKLSLLPALRDLFADGPRLFATFPELDHYGTRPDAQYIGPLLGIPPHALRVDWPESKGPKVFACLRPDTSHVQAILSALAMTTARVICVAQGFRDRQLASFRKPHILFYRRPVDLAPLRDADLCISYGAEGTTIRFLLAGCPQLVSPWHVEAFMAARKLARAGLGLLIVEEASAAAVGRKIEQLVIDKDVCSSVAAFAARYRLTKPGDSLLRKVLYPSDWRSNSVAATGPRTTVSLALT